MDNEARIKRIKFHDWALPRLKVAFVKAYFISEKQPVWSTRASLDRWRNATLMRLRILKELKERGYVPYTVTLVKFRRLPCGSKRSSR